MYIPFLVVPPIRYRVPNQRFFFKISTATGLLLLTSLVVCNALADSGSNHKHRESHITTSVEPEVLNIEYSPTKGVSGDTTFKVVFKRRGDGGTFCNKFDFLSIGSSRETASSITGYGGDPIKYATTDFHLCTFTKRLNGIFWETKRYFASLCKDKIGKSFNTSFLTKAYTFDDNIKSWVWKVRIPVRLECGCKSPQFSINGRLQNATLGQSYSTSLQARDGANPIRYNLNGVIPPGLRINSSGVLEGKPTVSGEFSFSVTATDSCPTGPEQDTKELDIKVCAVQSGMLSDHTLPNGYKDSQYRFPLQATGTRPIKYTVLDWRDLPTGVSLSRAGTGLLEGIPSSTGRHRFTIKTEDACGKIKETSIVINVQPNAGCQELSIQSPANLPEAQLEKRYTYNLGASGGGSQISYKLKSGSLLPPGFTLDLSGRIHGIPTSGGRSFTVVASNACGNTRNEVEKTLSLRVIAPSGARIALTAQSNVQKAVAKKQTVASSSTNTTKAVKKQAAASTPINKRKFRTEIIRLKAGSRKVTRVIIPIRNLEKASSARVIGPNGKPVPGIKLRLGKAVKGGREVFLSAGSKVGLGKNYSLAFKTATKIYRVPVIRLRIEIVR